MKSIAALTAGLGVLTLTSTAHAATLFELDNFDVNLNNSDPGLVLNWSPVLNTPVSHTLDVGESVTFDLFEIWTNETTVNKDDKATKPISVDFSFSSPEIFGGTVEGDTSGISFLGGIIQSGQVAWNDPLTLAFGNGGKLGVSLSDEFFNFGLFGLNPGQAKGATVEATFTLIAESSKQVPEPSGLLGLSLLGLGFLGKKLVAKRTA